MVRSSREKVLADLEIPLARDNLPGLVSNLVSNTVTKFERKISRKKAVRVGKEMTLFIWNEDVNDINKKINKKI